MDNINPVVCVFCGSSHGSDAAHASAARRMGTLIGEHGFDLLFGGGYVGLMGEVARSAREAGARVTGVLPEFLRYLEPPSPRDESVIFTADLQERKRVMLSKSDAFVVLAGGLGTLDEFFEVITSAQLGELPKPVVLVDHAGFYASLEALLARIVSEGFARPDIRSLYRRVERPEEAIDLLRERLGRPARA
jgi:uncharacterized protein (TIGR00730 family)